MWLLWEVEGGESVSMRVWGGRGGMGGGEEGAGEGEGAAGSRDLLLRGCGWWSGEA